MKSFTLKIVTPDGVQYDGQAEELVVRTVAGDLGILAGHINTVAPLGMGQAMVLTEGQKRYGACIGGMVSVVNGAVTLVPTTFEWADKIDVARAEASKKRAETVLQNKNATDTEIALAEARLKRALVRTSVATYKPR
ncbi:MAG: ATP synthase F1 subunit epsilon [Oscillospiraceae bacterium]|nr:ATP synthase F1 subunit epsilon [Oscillospiraceae bacterium]